MMQPNCQNGIETRIPNNRPWIVFCAALLFISVREPVLFGQDAPEKTIYQDFRNKRPLLASFTLVGPDTENEVKPEVEGLRITLAAARTAHWPTDVATTFVIAGDFEITGTFEVLSAEQPAKGYGLGVHLNVADTDQRVKFAKVSRTWATKEGSVFLTEHWHAKKDYQRRNKRTGVKTGQLRLTRIGASLRYLVSEGPGQKFRELWFQEDFGRDDLEHVRFGVSDSGEPGNPVDARLIDLRIRTAPTLPDKAFDPAPLAEPAPQAESTAAAESPTATSPLLIGLGAALAVALGLSAWLYLRSRRLAAKGPADGAASSSFVQCLSCGKKLKVRCPQCGEALSGAAIAAAHAIECRTRGK